MKIDAKKIEREYNAPIPINQLLAYLKLKINFYRGVGGGLIYYFTNGTIAYWTL